MLAIGADEARSAHQIPITFSLARSLALAFSHPLTGDLKGFV